VASLILTTKIPSALLVAVMWLRAGDALGLVAAPLVMGQQNHQTREIEYEY
jgi:hypothetical protein